MSFRIDQLAVYNLATVGGSITAGSFVKSGGTSSQFLKADGSVDTNTYITGITSGMVTTALGYTPVPNSRTLTINGTTYDLTADRSWTISIPVTSVSGSGSGISVSPTTGAVVVSNTGVTSNVAGTGISVSGATGAVTITNTGVTSIVAGTAITVSGATGAVTINNAGVTSLNGSTGALTGFATQTWVTSQGYITGNQTITLSGDVTGSGTTSIATTLANSGVSAGTYGGNNSIPSLVIDAKGRVTSASTVTPSGTWGISISGNSATTSQTNFTSLTVNSNTVLHAGNYNSYSPTLTGGGASGTWSISITGNAATATSATSATSASYAGYVNGTTGQLYTKDDRIIEPNSISSGYMQFGFTSWTNNNNSPWADYIHLRSYTDASGGNDNLVMFRKDAIGMRIWQQSWNSGTAYSSYVDVLHSSNYNSYSPTLTGGGASGTWSINVTGTAASETLATVTGRGASTSSLIVINNASQISNNTSIDPASYPNKVVVGAVGDSGWRVTTGIGGNAGTNHNWTFGHNGINLYFGISNGSSASLSTWMQVSPSRTINLNAYTTNGFLKTINSDGTLSVDTNTYATQSWVTSQGYITSASVGNGTLTLAVSGSGLSGSASFTANQSGNTTFTVTSNATTSATANTIAYRDSGGDLYTRYFFGSYVNTSDNDETGITRFIIKNGDNYHRSATTSTAMTIIRGVASGTWGIDITGSSGSATQVVTIQDAPPSGVNGKLWWESDTGRLKVYYATSSAWVDATPIPDMSLYYAKAGGPISGSVSIQQTLTVAGNTLIQGTLTETSDISLKENIVPLKNSLDKVTRLKGVSFNKKATPEVKEIGFIAQEVEAVIPELITETDEGIKTVSYSRVTAVLVETIKEQQEQIDQLKDLVNKLTEKLNNL